MMQSVLLIDVVGNKARYTVSDDDFRWSTEFGDSGVAQSLVQAQHQARTVLKARMAADRRSDEAATAAQYLPYQDARRRLMYNRE